MIYIYNVDKMQISGIHAQFNIEKLYKNGMFAR